MSEQQQPKEHCDHECVCWAYRENKLPARKDPCPRNSGGAWASCTEDTRSRPHPAPAQGTSKLCFGTITLIAEECRKCNEIEACKQKQSVIDYQKREIAAEAARKAREDVLSGLIDLASNYFETLEDGANRGLPLTSDVEAIPPSKLLEWIESLRTAQSEQAGDGDE